MNDGVSVLLIEDDRSVAEVMEALLVEWGCSVRVAFNGSEALDRAAEGHVDVVLSDLSLPDLTAAELLPRLRRLESCRNALCVSVSGRAGAQGEDVSRRAGFDQHLIKPVPLDRLRAILARVDPAS